MRVVAGKFKGRHLKALPGKNTRPTTDKVKGAIFNMIGPYFSTGKVLDLYSGSGGLGIEAISRGMEQAYLVDKDYGAYKILQENVALTKEEDAFTLWKMPDKKALEKAKDLQLEFDLVFLDPPYAKQKIVEVVEKLIADKLLAKEVTIVCETDEKIILPETIQHLEKKKDVVYSSSRVTIYQ